MGTQRSKANLEAAVTSNITTNGVGDITGSILNTLFDDFIESLIFNNGTTTIDNISLSSSWTASSGNDSSLTISSTANQSGTAGYRGLTVNVTETSTGSGAAILFDCNVDGSPIHRVWNTGVVQAADRASSPGTPDSGTGYLYFKTDGKYYAKNDAGTEYDLTDTGTGDVTKVGTPVDSQIGVWTGDGTIEGSSLFTWDGDTFNVDQSSGTGNFYFGDIENSTIQETNVYIHGKSGGDTDLLVTNAGNGDARIEVKTTGTNDPCAVFAVTDGGDRSWCMGIDNSDSDIFKITTMNQVGFSTPSDGTVVMEIETGGNFGFNGGSYGGGSKVLFIADRLVAPTSNPTSGGILYTESGALKYRGSSGTITTIANA